MNAKHSPLIALRSANARLDVAFQNCPHWDYEADTLVELDDCCREVSAARAEWQRCKKAVKAGAA